MFQPAYRKFQVLLFYIMSLFFKEILNSFYISIYKYQLSFEVSFIFATTSATYDYLGLRFFIFDKNQRKYE